MCIVHIEVQDRGQADVAAGRRKGVATPADTALLLDAMLGKLATYLRMCGYDAAYALDRGVEDDEQLRTIADREDRVLLTRDVELASRAREALLLESRDVRGQLAALSAEGYHLSLDVPTRCSGCNGRLERLPETGSTPEFAPDPADRPVWYCADCDQCFWRGDHWEDVARRLEGL